MPRSRSYLSKRVSARIDEIIPSGENIGGGTAIEDPIETIYDELDFSAIYVLRTAKLPLVYSAIEGDKKHFHGTSVNDVDTRLIIDPDKRVTIVCPEDFLRAVACRISSWSRDVKDFYHQNDPIYRSQEGNNYTSGSPDKPIGALVSFYDYITTITHGAVTNGPFEVGEVITGGTSGATATIKELTSSTVMVVEFTSGHFAAAETITGGTSGASATIAAGGVVDEYNKWVIAHEFDTNQTIADLDDDNGNISTGDVFIVTGQDDSDENGTYLCNASGEAPTKLSNSTTTTNSKTAIECYRANSVNDTLEKFHYIRVLKAEEMPDDLIDAMIWHCAGSVLQAMQRNDEATFAKSKADELLGVMKTGLKGEV